MQKKKRESDSIKVPKVVIYIIFCILYIVLTAGLAYISFLNYEPSNVKSGEKSIFDILIDELGNTITITSGVACLFADMFAEKGQTISVWTKRIIAVSVFLLFNFCRCANAIGLSINQFSVIIFVFYGIVLFLVIITIPRSVVFKDTNNIGLKAALGKIKNQNILSIQLFEVTESKEGEYTTYNFKYIDGLCQYNNDINGMLSASYRLRSEDIAAMMLVLVGYQRLIESGDVVERATLLSSIQQNKEKLLDRLKQIQSVDQVSKEDCCMARLVILYITIENMLKDSGSAGIEAPNGILGLDDNEIENRLFTLFRTGILGALFLGKNDIYTFNYWKNGLKTGRKYCAFQLDGLEKSPPYICMIVLKERQNSIISMDIVQAIHKIEKNLFDKMDSIRGMGI